MAGVGNCLLYFSISGRRSWASLSVALCRTRVQTFTVKHLPSFVTHHVMQKMPPSDTWMHINVSAHCLHAQKWKLLLYRIFLQWRMHSSRLRTQLLARRRLEGKKNVVLKQTEMYATAIRVSLGPQMDENISPQPSLLIAISILSESSPPVNSHQSKAHVRIGAKSLWHHLSHFLGGRDVVPLWHNWRYLGLHPAAIIVCELAVVSLCLRTVDSGGWVGFYTWNRCLRVGKGQWSVSFRTTL